MFIQERKSHGSSTVKDPKILAMMWSILLEAAILSMNKNRSYEADESC